MQASTPLVTVGIPTYNRPEGLKRTLDCITHQTYSNLEIIVSDNCSPQPEVRALLEKYASIDSRVKFYIQEKNLSIIPNFQFLLDKANGDYFMWAADDDNWDPNFIEVCANGLQSNPSVVLCIGDLKLIGEGGVPKDSKLNRSFLQNNLFSRSFHFVKSTADTRYFFCGLYRSSLVKNIPFDNSWGGDHLFIYEAITKGKFLYVPGQANCYYFRGGSSKGMATVRKAFNIKGRYYFFDAYILRYATYQFGFSHLSFLKKCGLFFSNALALVLNDDFILYYIFIKKPLKSLFRTKKQ